MKSIKERDKELARVTHMHWHSRALDIISKVKPGRELMGEDIRALVNKAIGPAHHPNAYGSLIMAAAKGGLIEKTGQYLPSKCIASHGRYQPVWRKGNGYKMERHS
jgi:hypothetical protein